MPRKPKKSAQFLDAEETVLNFKALLQPTKAAWMRREAAIRRYAETVGADPLNSEHRQMMFGLLAWCAFPDHVKKIERRTGRPRKWDVSRKRKLISCVQKLLAGDVKYKLFNNGRFSINRAADLLIEHFPDDFGKGEAGAIAKQLQILWRWK